MSDPDYSLLERVLHRLALQYAPVAEMTFDLDQAMVRGDPQKIVGERHVFVTGLARAGTTVLMRRLHASGPFRSLTYRDMPFVLAPNLWRRLSSISRKDLEAAERAHGDRVVVDADSPESLDEVFWRIFAGDQYIEKSCLKPHAPSDATIGRYVRYVNAILAAQDEGHRRYLCKNNNNVLRLGAILSAFPQAAILIPFRDPLQHAQSLLRQHRQFCDMQRSRPFILSYMTWLGHHEFGLGHRPFRFADSAPSPYAPDTLDYWLQLWCETYEWLERSKPGPALLVCYEDLCEQPECWTRLASRVGIPAGGESSGDPFRLNQRPVVGQPDADLAARAAALYERLVACAREGLD